MTDSSNELDRVCPAAPRLLVTPLDARSTRAPCAGANADRRWASGVSAEPAGKVLGCSLTSGWNSTWWSPAGTIGCSWVSRWLRRFGYSDISPVLVGISPVYVGYSPVAVGYAPVWTRISVS